MIVSTLLIVLLIVVYVGVCTLKNRSKDSTEKEATVSTFTESSCQPLLEQMQDSLYISANDLEKVLKLFNPIDATNVANNKMVSNVAHRYLYQFDTQIAELEVKIQSEKEKSVFCAEKIVEFIGAHRIRFAKSPKANHSTKSKFMEEIISIISVRDGDIDIPKLTLSVNALIHFVENTEGKYNGRIMRQDNDRILKTMHCQFENAVHAYVENGSVLQEINERKEKAEKVFLARGIA